MADSEEKKPILPTLIFANRDAMVDFYPNDGTYKSGAEAKADLLRLLAEQLADYKKNTADDYIVKGSTINFYEKAQEKLSSILLDDPTGKVNISENSQYVMSIARANDLLSDSGARTTFDKAELFTNKFRGNDHSTQVITSEEGLSDIQRAVLRLNTEAGVPTRLEDLEPSLRNSAPTNPLEQGRAAIEAALGGPANWGTGSSGIRNNTPIEGLSGANRDSLGGLSSPNPNAVNENPKSNDIER